MNLWGGNSYLVRLPRISSEALRGLLKNACGFVTAKM
jgi:hypothetical protein